MRSTTMRTTTMDLHTKKRTGAPPRSPRITEEEAATAIARTLDGTAPTLRGGGGGEEEPAAGSNENGAVATTTTTTSPRSAGGGKKTRTKDASRGGTTEAVHKKKSNTLLKMILATAANKHGCTWSHVLQYLKAHTVVDERPAHIREQELLQQSQQQGRGPHHPPTSPASTTSSYEASPLPPNRLASAALLQNLQDPEVILAAIANGCPPRILTAIIILYPDRLEQPDSLGRLPLHLTCRYPPGDAIYTSLRVLIQAQPRTIWHGDHLGRTALHYVLWYHAEKRTVETIRLFLQSPDRTNRAKITGVADRTTHQSLPLHYAAAFHARRSVLHYLLAEDPGTKHAVDAQGRTPLHWYVSSAICSATNAAGEEYDENAATPEAAAAAAAAEFSNAVVGSGGANSGDHNSINSVSNNNSSIVDQWDVDAVRLLATSRTARTVDHLERTVLHTACQTIGLACAMAAVAKTAVKEKGDDDNNEMDGQPPAPHNPADDEPSAALTTSTHHAATIVQVLLDTHAGQLVMQDVMGRTPVLLLLETFLDRQRVQWEADHATSLRRRPRLLRFDPPPQVLTLLQKNPHVAGLESHAGRLPLHLALAMGAPLDQVRAWLDLNPAGLLHVDEMMRVALHEAFRHPWSALLQDGPTIALLLQQSCEKNGVNVDGRLAMKMEDTDGNYPVHLACANGASVEVIQTLIGRYPRAALLLNPNDDLPIHCLLSDEAFRDPASIREKVRVMLPPLLAAPHALHTPDSRYGMMPLHIMVYFQAAEYADLLKLLDACPASAEHFSKAILGCAGPQASSPLDLHEMNRPDDGNLTEWHLIRELLFAYSPTLASHRHRQELLERCVAIIVDDITVNGGSSHLRKDRDHQDGAVADMLDLTHTVSNMEAQINTKKFLRTQSFLNRRQRLTAKSGGTPNSSNGSRGRREFVMAMGPTRPNRQALPPHMSFSMSEDTINSRGSRIAHSATSNSRTSNSRVSRSGTSMSRVSRSGTSTSRTSNSRTSNSRTTNSRTSIYDDESTGLEDYDTQSHVDDEDEDSSYGSEEGTSSSGTEDPTEGATTTWEGDGTEGEFTTEGGTYSSGEDESRTLSQSVSASLSNAHSSSFEHDTFIDDVGMSNGFGKRGQRTLELNGKNSVNSSVSLTMMDQMKSSESSHPSVLKTPRRGNQENRRGFSRPSFMSEVGMRLWTFFMLYRDPKNPGDNYARQIGQIVDAIELEMIELMVTHPIPPYASKYLGADPFEEALCYREAACPKCREIVQKTCFFLGLYDFRNDGDTLVSRGWNGSYIDVKAFEWIFTTEEETEAKSPGVAEENIWSSGEVPPEIGLTYRTSKRLVMIRFLTSKDQYEVEIARQLLPRDENESFLRMLTHFNAFGTERQVDLTYEAQIQDPHFNKIKTGTFDSEIVELQQYPFAVVYEYPTQGTLLEYNRRCGMDDPQAIRQLAMQLAKGLSSLHSIEYCGIGVTDRNVVMLDEMEKKWGFMSLAKASKVGTLAGGINDKGLACFSMDSLPPTMFEELSPHQLRQYEDYWKIVRDRFHVNVDERLTRPLISHTTGVSWVVKCHFIPLTTSGENVTLPYQLVEVSKHHDIWSFGMLLLELLSGRRMLRRDDRFGSLTDYSDIIFNAEPLVLEYITDPAAQDLLLRCLSAQPADFTVADILVHPYILGNQPPRMAQSLSHRTASFSRDIARKHKASSQQKSKAISGDVIQSWDLALLEKFFMSPSSLLASKFDSICPCSIVLLPNGEEDMSCGKLGHAVLSLIKACYFASVMQQAMGDLSPRQPRTAHAWPANTAMRVLDLTNTDFADIQQRMEHFATRHVEAYRSDPLSIAVRIAKDRLADVVSCFPRELYIGFVDEYTGRRSGPVIEVAAGGKSALLMSTIPLLVITCVHVMGLSKDLTGAARLFRCTTVPPEWVPVAAGIPCELSETVMMNILQALEEYFGGVDFHAWERFCRGRNFHLLRRMESTAGGSLWTTEQLLKNGGGGSMRDIVTEFQRLKSNAAAYSTTTSTTNHHHPFPSSGR